MNTEMQRKILMLLLLPLIGPGLFPLSGDTFETSYSCDGGMRMTGTVLYRGKSLSSGAHYRYSPEDSDDFMAGFNCRALSVGHLGDAGLAAEMRNPGSGALARFGERTFVRADLRSLSRSRLGMAYMPFKERVGLCLEKREEIESISLWVIPLAGDYWTSDVMCELISTSGEEPDDAWYPEDDGMPAGLVSILGTRLGYHRGGWNIGITGMTSRGKAIRPGYLAALTWIYSEGAWRLRSRTVMAGKYFRSADMENPDGLLETGFDCRYRPKRGIRFDLGYEAREKKDEYGIPGFSDEGSLACGWDFGEILLSAETTWNRIGSKPIDDEQYLRRVKASFQWNRGLISFGFAGIIEPSLSWRITGESAFPSSGPFLLRTKIEVHKETDPILVDIGIKCRWNLGSDKLLIELEFSDLPRDWNPSPSSTGDFGCGIRYIFHPGHHGAGNAK